MRIRLFRRFILSGLMFCAGVCLITWPAYAEGPVAGSALEIAEGPASGSAAGKSVGFVSEPASGAAAGKAVRIVSDPTGGPSSGVAESWAASSDEGAITGVCSYRTGEAVDTSDEAIVLQFREGIIFRMKQMEDTEYSFFMEGPDRQWTDWSARNYKEYTNLGRGRYTFMYRYRSGAGDTEGEGSLSYSSGTGDTAGEGSFSFRVRAPWYFSPLAWIIYPLLLVLAGMMLRIRTHRLFMERQKRLEQLIAERTEELQHEKEKSDNLLANMLPKGTAEEIMLKGKAAKTKYNFVTVLFSDIQGFTKIAEEMNPEVLIDELDRFFFHFDSLAEKYRIEKIKTIGDAYMCAGGIPERNRTNPVEVVLAALEMQKYMQFMKNDPAKTAARFWDIRIGIHTGTVIAGVVGHKKITYDIWGDTVNTASRMESSGEPGKINISGTTYEFVKEYFICDYRGRMPVKYKGDLDMYFVTGIRPELCEPDGLPNRRFFTKMEMIRILDVEEHVFTKYSETASPDLFFHSVEYIRSVTLQADLLARAEKLEDNDYIHVRLASVFVFLGYAFDYDDPLSASKKRAGEILSVYGFGPQTLEVVTALIDSAFIPEQDSIAGMVLHDAVYEFTGRIDFITMIDRLFREEMAYGKIDDTKTWFRKMASTIEENEFLTETARKLRSVHVQEQLSAFQTFAGEKHNNS